MDCQRFGKHRNGLRRFRCPGCKKTYTEAHRRVLETMYIPQEKAVMALRLLLEGNSIRSTERITESGPEYDYDRCWSRLGIDARL